MSNCWGLPGHKYLVDGLQFIDEAAEACDALGRLDEASVRILQHGIGLAPPHAKLVSDVSEQTEHAERILLLLVRHDGKVVLLLCFRLRLCLRWHGCAADNEQHDDQTFHIVRFFIVVSFVPSCISIFPAPVVLFLRMPFGPVLS